MIRVDIDQVVEQQLRHAFPSSRTDVSQHLLKYIKALEAAILDAMMHKNSFKLFGKRAYFRASTHKIANAGPQLGPQKLRLHKWLKDNQLELIKTGDKGDKFRGQNSLVPTI